jgi:enoyl-CoA hydratase/3-hydroxyacyl-CoA dehydrogenase
MTLPNHTGVVGAGLMGRDIAGLLANGGLPVTLVDVDPDALESAHDDHADLAARLEAAGHEVDGDPASRIDYDTDLAALADCEFVVEVVPERLDLKRSVMADLESVLDPDAVIGTNTSSLTAGEIAAEMDHPGRVVLFHFANPALERDLVEISGEGASDEALATATEVAEAMDRHPVRLQREHRANCLSRLSASIKCAGTWELLEAEAAAIDHAARNIGFDRGPLEFVDLVGLDVHLATVDNLRVAYGERYAPPETVEARMREMVDAGHLGKKTGRGFFEWDGETCLLPEVEQGHDVTPVVAALVNEAYRLIEDEVGDRETVNGVLKRGSGGDTGPFDIEAMLGTDFLRETLESRYAETGAEVYEPAF